MFLKTLVHKIEKMSKKRQVRTQVNKHHSQASRIYGQQIMAKCKASSVCIHAPEIAAPSNIISTPRTDPALTSTPVLNPHTLTSAHPSLTSPSNSKNLHYRNTLEDLLNILQFIFSSLNLQLNCHALLSHNKGYR